MKTEIEEAAHPHDSRAKDGPLQELVVLEGAIVEHEYDCDDSGDDEERPFCWCCQNSGTINCYCGGDFCVCENNGEMPCPKCDRGLY